MGRSNALCPNRSSLSCEICPHGRIVKRPFVLPPVQRTKLIKTAKRWASRCVSRGLAVQCPC